MKIVYFYQYFTTPKGSYGTRVYEFVKNWIEAGHEVVVVTSIYSKSDLRANSFLENQTIEGIKLKVINIKIDNKHSFFKRIFTFVVYTFFSIYYSLTLNYDVAISSSGPISIGLPGLAAKIFRNKKFVFEVRDLWPEAPIELGIIKNKYLKKIAYYFEKMCYNNSDLIVALSLGMRLNILERFPNANVVSVTNSANFQLFSKAKKQINNPKLANKKYAIYSGNIGYVNNTELLYKASMYLTKIGRNDIVIVLIGDGQQKDYFKKQTSGLETILFIDLLPKLDLVNYLKNSIASIIPLNDLPMLSTSSPNKLFESMAAGIPVLQTTNGWIKEMLEISNAGYTISPNNEQELVEKIIFLADNPCENKKIGKRGFEYARLHFDKNILSNTMINHIHDIF